MRNYVNTSEGKTFVDGHGISEWDRLSPVKRRLCEKLREIERLFSYARSNREKASGDLSSLCQAWCGASETLVKLFATNACNSILAKDNVEKRVVAMASSVEDFDAAMAEIVEMEECWSQDSRLYVNVTPEHKAESAHLTAAAVVLGVDNYMHEASNDIEILQVFLQMKYLEMLKSLSKEAVASDAERIMEALENLGLIWEGV